MRKFVIIGIVELISSISRGTTGVATNTWMIMCLKQCLWNMITFFVLIFFFKKNINGEDCKK